MLGEQAGEEGGREQDPDDCRTPSPTRKPLSGALKISSEIVSSKAWNLARNNLLVPVSRLTRDSCTSSCLIILI